jgi:hypothetical protein
MKNGEGQTGVSLSDFSGDFSSSDNLLYKASKSANDFNALANSLPDEINWLFRDIIKFFARTARASRSNGLTPDVLASLFGVLIFGPGLVDPVHEVPGLETYNKRYLRSTRALQCVLELYMREEVSKGQQESALVYGAVHMERSAFVETTDARDFPRTDVKKVEVGQLPPKSYNIRACIPDDLALASAAKQPSKRPTGPNGNIADLQWLDFSEKGFGGAVDGVGELVADVGVSLNEKPIINAGKTKSSSRPPLPFIRADTNKSTFSVNGPVPDQGPERDWTAAYAADAKLVNYAPSKTKSVAGGAIGGASAGQSNLRYEFEDGFVDCFMLLGADWFDRADCIFDNVSRRPEPVKTVRTLSPSHLGYYIDIS